MAQFFCPYCFAEVGESVESCPACGQNILRWERSQTYTARLVQALKHPIDEVRMGTVITLGQRGEPRTASALVECAFRFPTMITQNVEIIGSLKRFPVSRERDIALDLLTRHPSRPICKLAKAALADGSYERAEQEGQSIPAAP